MHPLRILFVTEHYPYPTVPHAGGQDYWHWIDALRQNHHIYVATFDDAEPTTPADALQPYVDQLAIVRTPFGGRIKTHLKRQAESATAQTPFAALLRAARSVRLAARRFSHAQMRRIVRDWCDRYQIDVLHCGWTTMGRYLHASTRPMLRVLDEVDVRFLVEENAARQGSLAPEWVAQRKADELAYCAAADRVIVRSDHDLVALKAHLPNLNGVVLRSLSGVARLLEIDPNNAEPNRIMLVGAFDRDANINAARWMTLQCLPLIRAAIPAAELWLVGARPHPSVSALAQHPGVVVTGYVPDLYPYYAAASVIVAPTQVPSGNLVKIIDGLAAGRPIVATEIAARSINAPCVLTADDPAAFAEIIIRLLGDTERWRALCQASRQFAQKHFDPQYEIARLEMLYLQGLKEKGAR
jgi:glycosyltransferase involved in cell wall biosynthesis